MGLGLRVEFRHFSKSLKPTHFAMGVAVSGSLSGADLHISVSWLDLFATAPVNPLTRAAACGQ